MDADLAQKSVSAALCGDWKEAISLNKEILAQDPQNIDALNRLARAYSEIGNIKKAKALSQKVLKIDPFNTIAAKSVRKWKQLKPGEAASGSLSGAEAFLEEPGKTKIVPLLYLGGASILSKLDAGSEVKLTPSSHRVSVVTQEGKYIGRLPDDLSARLRKLIKMGNVYQILVKSIAPNDVKVFIREIERNSKFSDVASFPPERIDYISFTPPELVRKRESAFSDSEEED